MIPSSSAVTGQTAIVIGSGFGGLALAIRLQTQGVQTMLLEGRDQPGGRAYVYRDHGFTFDGGPTVITDPTCLNDLFVQAGKRMADYVDLMPITPFYRLQWEDGTTFDYVNNQQQLEQQIAALNPADVAGYNRFLAYSKSAMDEGYLKLGHVAFPDFRSMVRVAPQLMKMQAWRSVYSIVSGFVQNEHLRQALSFHSLLVGGNPFATSSIYTLIHALEREWGVYFPKGGTGALINGMVRLFEDLGGTVHLSAPVARIDTQEHSGRTRATGVTLHDGRSFTADIVASNADVVHTYQKLLGHTAAGQKEGRRLARKRHSMSLFVIYFGLNRPETKLAHHTVLFGARYRELLQDIFHGRTLPDDFSLYLHAPTVSDPSLAPPGHAAYYVLAPVPHLGQAELDWNVVGPQYRERIFDYLEKHAIPDLRQHLVTSRLLTPFGFRDDLNAHHGSAFSLEPVLRQSAYFRAHNRSTTVQGLYLVGAGTHPGAGVPGVVGAARATAGLILADHGLDATSATQRHPAAFAA